MKAAFGRSLPTLRDAASRRLDEVHRIAAKLLRRPRSAESDHGQPSAVPRGYRDVGHPRRRKSGDFIATMLLQRMLIRHDAAVAEPNPAIHAIGQSQIVGDGDYGLAVIVDEGSQHLKNLFARF